MSSNDWAAPVGADGVVSWRFSGEFPCGYRWAVSPSQEGAGVQPEEPINVVAGVHVVKADWVADQAREAHDRLCACTFEEDGVTWEGYEFDVTTVTLTKERYDKLLATEARLEGNVVVALGAFQRLLASEEKLEALEAGGVDEWQGYNEALRDVWAKEGDDDGGSEAA